MSFEWFERTPGKKHGSQQRAKVLAVELADRAGTLFRLGFSQAAATARLIARVAWEFEPSSKHGGPHRRPASLADAEISKIVADTYARRPGGW